MTGESTVKAPKSEAGPSTKMNRPHKVFEHPAEVVADPDLSKDQKRVALESLEQDARQLATASEEGMTGGESSNLREVLVAKETLDSPASEAAFAVVIQSFESKLAESEGTAAHEVIVHAIDSISAARRAIGKMGEAPRTPPGAAKPGSDQELEEELEKERLDP
jgi:hypothetical protein